MSEGCESSGKAELASICDTHHQLLEQCRIDQLKAGVARLNEENERLRATAEQATKVLAKAVYSNCGKDAEIERLWNWLLRAKVCPKCGAGVAAHVPNSMCPCVCHRSGSLPVRAEAQA